MVPPDKADAQATAGQFALEIMHEIKNPLEALGHLTYLAYEEADEPEKVRKYMRLAEEQMATLNHIVSQTLGFASSSESKRLHNLANLARAAIRLHQRKILQVVSNLLVNAIDALPSDGTLHLRLRKHDGHIHLIVADNGEGIPREHLQKIFEPYFTTKEERGTGLGLALSKRIAERHNGRISVRSSVRPGKSGTIFRLCLPA